MPKALCMSGMAVAILIAMLFLADLVGYLVGADQMAPFRGVNITMDIAMIVCAAFLGVASWLTFRVQI